MAGKKTKINSKKEFSSTPFSQLKGVSVPDPSKPKTIPNQPVEAAPVPSSSPKTASFYDEMTLLGVKPIHGDDDDDGLTDEDVVELLEADIVQSSEDNNVSGDELFLAAMQDLEVRFHEPTYEEDIGAKIAPLPRRMKQLRRGKITPDASLDLHGLTRADVAPKLKHFIGDARYHGWQTLLVITGRGLHSESGDAVLRAETEDVINRIGKDDIAEWGYAPQRYGGQGAIVLFLKSK
jgi:DNA-nicking Smr family endonuclease